VSRVAGILLLSLLWGACSPGSCRGSREAEGVLVVRDGQQLRRIDKDIYRAFYDAQGRLQVVEFDANRDGRAEQTDHHRGGARRPYLTELDRNSDGDVERREHYGDDGRLLRVEEGPARPSVTAEYDGQGQPRRVSRDTDKDGRADRTEEYVGGLLTTTAVDTDRDGRPDRWQRWVKGHMVSEELDTDADGLPDRRLRYGERGELLGLEPFKPSP
jgi:hypothetical protein